MKNLALIYRPTTFADVRGQDAVVSYLINRVKNPESSSQAIFLYGPPGTGKTTLARIYAQALNCAERANRADGTFCGRCSACKDFEGGSNFFYCEWDAARWSKFPDPSETLQMFASKPLDGDVRIVFFDEVHRLEGRSADALLKLVEEPPPWLTFVFASSEPAGVRPALLSRCHHLETRPLGRAEGLAWLMEICAWEEITYEPAALRMLVDRSRGSPREMVSTLAQVSAFGHVDAPTVSRALGLDWTHYVVDYAKALGRGDLLGQIQPIEAWTAQPRAKGETIRDLLLYLYNYEVGVPRVENVVNPAFHQIDAAERRLIAAPLEDAARTEGLTPDGLWMQMMAFWSREWPAKSEDDAALDIAIRRFHRLVNPETAPLRDCRPSSASATPARRRRRVRKAPGGVPVARASAQYRGAYLDHGDVGEIWSAASFLLQEYGAPLNMHVELRQRLSGRDQHHDAAKLVSNLTHELQMRAKGWAGKPCLHWLYVHEVDDEGKDLLTNLMISMPDALLDRAASWMEDAVPRLAGPTASNVECCATRQDRKSAAASVNAHWGLIHILCRGLDPDLIPDGSTKPLIELIGVPKRLWAPIGDPACRRRRGVSATLGDDVMKQLRQERFAPLSAFDDGAWTSLCTGWELNERVDRDRDRSLRQAQRRDLDAEHPPTGVDYEQRERRSAIEEWEASWPADPHSRRRTWQGWWKE